MENKPNPNGANQYVIECINCNKLKRLSSFELRSDTKTYRKSCKKCENNRKSLWYSNNKVNVKIQQVAKKYGLSEKDYEILVKYHNKLCAICGKEEDSIDGRTKLKKSLSVDHNHRTGKVRGLLCWRCNAMIGYAKEDIKNLKNGVKYLEKYEQI